MDSSFKSAICTNCGSELKLDTAKKMCFCNICGSKITVADAVRKFQILFPTRAQSEEAGKPPEAGAQPQASGDAAKPAQAASSASPPQPAAPATVSYPEETESQKQLTEMLEAAQRHLNSREYIKASDIYNKIINDIDAENHAAYWGLFLVDERNFNLEEKLLQCYSCFPFRGGVESIRKEIFNNQNLSKALNNSTGDERKFYNDEVVKYSDNLYNVYREGIDNLIAIAEHRFDMLCNTFETIGIVASASRIGYPSGVGIKVIPDKTYFHFSVNRLGMLHMDILSLEGQPTPVYTLWHYRHVLMNTDNGTLSWSEFRNFRNCNEAETIYGELDAFHKIGYALMGVWRDKLIVRTGNKVIYLKAVQFPEHITEVFLRCYQTVCVPIVEDPNSWNTGHKSSEFYQVMPISSNFETAKKSKWIRKKVAGCYIATAVYGGYDTPQVMILRRFRDNVLSRSRAGRAFIDIYYTLSPPLAKRLKSDSLVTRAVRRVLDAFVNRLKETHDDR